VFGLTSYWPLAREEKEFKSNPLPVLASGQ
jgi:hypothetical protein